MNQVYETSPIKRSRASKSEMKRRREALFQIVSAMKPMTVRQVFYQATVRDIIDKTEAEYDKVQRALVDMRRAGVIPYDWIADNTRWQRKPIAALRARGLWDDAESDADDLDAMGTSECRPVPIRGIEQ